VPILWNDASEFIFDVLETPLRDLSGDIIYEGNSRAISSRRAVIHSEFWRDKYEAFRLIQDVKTGSLRKEAPSALSAARCRIKRLPFGARMSGRNFGTCCAVLS